MPNVSKPVGSNVWIVVNVDIYIDETDLLELASPDFTTFTIKCEVLRCLDPSYGRRCAKWDPGSYFAKYNTATREITDLDDKKLTILNLDDTLHVLDESIAELLNKD